MITLESALKILSNFTFFPDTEKIALTKAYGRVLARDLLSDIYMPPFNKSAMDGYACRKEDLKNTLEVIEVVVPGEAPVKTIKKNECSKIMTGAMVPEGADCVIMIEHTEIVDENRIRIVSESTKTNICLMGEDAKPNDLLLINGTRIKAQHLAVLASAGCAEPIVYKKPRIAIISTGDELVEPQQIPQISQIRNSNGYQLIVQVNNSGCLARYIGIIKDNEKILKESILNNLKKNDVLIITGGVSKGDFDFIPKILHDLKLEILFDRLAIQPGKPIVFATGHNKFCFGLSGNPVSSFFQFELVVKPFLYKMLGYHYNPVYQKMPMGVDYIRKKSDRELFFPVRIADNGTILPVEFHGSAHIRSLIEADGIVSIPIGQNKINKGTLSNVRPI